jgi:hypothetical protein
MHAMELSKHLSLDLPPVEVAGLGAVLGNRKVDLAIPIVGSNVETVDAVHERAAKTSATTRSGSAITASGNVAEDLRAGSVRCGPVDDARGV